PARKSWQESVAESVARAAQTTTTHAQVNRVATAPDTNFRPDPAPTPVVLLSELTYELLDRLEWKRVELIVALYFAETGARAECTCIGADGGVDVQLYRNGEQTPYCYVQCKAFGPKVDVKLVRELLGVMSAAKITEGVFVTTGRYTKDALNFAAQNNIQAISGVGFVDRFNQLPFDARTRILSKVTEGDYTTPTCSQCDIKMVLSSREPPQWRCRRCNNRQYVRKSRWSALRAAKR
ncbi:MAG TPA: restriction endonuclease, partial [Opitutus sp.]|nr:restriction endonuclease [Opitutus sp.]